MVEQREETGHTPGPWERFGKIGERELIRVRACVGKDRTGRNIYVEIHDKPEDARLIAAAPELLSLVARAYRALHRGQWEDGETDDELAERIHNVMMNHFGKNWLDKSI